MQQANFTDGPNVGEAAHQILSGLPNPNSTRCALNSVLQVIRFFPFIAQNVAPDDSIAARIVKVVNSLNKQLPIEEDDLEYLHQNILPDETIHDWKDAKEIFTKVADHWTQILVWHTLEDNPPPDAETQVLVVGVQYPPSIDNFPLFGIIFYMNQNHYITVVKIPNRQSFYIEFDDQQVRMVSSLPNLSNATPVAHVFIRNTFLLCQILQSFAIPPPPPITYHPKSEKLLFCHNFARLEKTTLSKICERKDIQFKDGYEQYPLFVGEYNGAADPTNLLAKKLLESFPFIPDVGEWRFKSEAPDIAKIEELAEKKNVKILKTKDLLDEKNNLTSNITFIKYVDEEEDHRFAILMSPPNPSRFTINVKEKPAGEFYYKSFGQIPPLQYRLTGQETSETLKKAVMLDLNYFGFTFSKIRLYASGEELMESDIRPLIAFAGRNGKQNNKMTVMVELIDGSREAIIENVSTVLFDRNIYSAQQQTGRLLFDKVVSRVKKQKKSYSGVNYLITVPNLNTILSQTEDRMRDLALTYGSQCVIKLSKHKSDTLIRFIQKAKKHLDFLFVIVDDLMFSVRNQIFGRPMF